MKCTRTPASAVVENLDHLSYLQRHYELELIERERRAAERRLEAGPLSAETLEDGSDGPLHVDIQKFAESMRGRNWHRGPLMGPSYRSG